MQLNANILNVRCAAAALEKPVYPQENKRSNEGHKEACALTLSIQAKSAAEKPGDERAGDAQSHGDEYSAWIPAWHDQLCQRAYNYSDNRNPYPVK